MYLYNSLIYVIYVFVSLSVCKMVVFYMYVLCMFCCHEYI